MSRCIRWRIFKDAGSPMLIEVGNGCNWTSIPDARWWVDDRDSVDAVLFIDVCLRGRPRLQL